MQYKFLGDDPLVLITLAKNERIKIENGSMVYHSKVNLEGKLNSNKKGVGALFGAIGRSLTGGESMFITIASGLSDDSYIGIAPAIPGKIMALEVGEKQYCLNTNAFLASDESVDYEMRAQSLGKALFGGTGGLFVMHTTGRGQILVNSYGDILEVEVNGEDVVIDNEHVVFWDSSLEYNIEIASGLFGFTSGEGIVNRFKGKGKVYIQTRNIASLAAAIRRFIPTSNN